MADKRPRKIAEKKKQELLHMKDLSVNWITYIYIIYWFIAKFDFAYRT
jgi:hypothetical protein